MKVLKTVPLLFSLFTFNAFSIEGMKPGLWEHSFTVKSQSGKVEKALSDVRKQLANMPAEQRQMMEQMMAKQGMGIGDQATSIKVCISKEQAENLAIPQGQEHNCTQEILKKTANYIKTKFKCNGTPPTDGEGEFTLTSPNAYTGKAVVNTEIQGKAERMDMNQTGKWISADCGNIKSLQAKK